MNMDSSPIISLSTSYLQKKFEGDGYAMLCRAAELGFEYVELGHSTTNASMEGIIRAVEEGIVKVSSLHNFCPVPPFATGAAPNLFSPATASNAESEQWLRHTKNTLEFAGRFGAKAVVCHCGFLSYFFMRPERALEKYIEKHPDANAENDPVYAKIAEKFKMRSARRAEKKDYICIENNVREIAPTAEKNGVLLGLENREAPNELPLDWNFEKLINALKTDTPARTWHDAGHSMRKQLLGLGTQLDLLERTSDSLIGWHLHDCTDAGKDHVAIGAGCIDFAKLSKFFDPKKHIFTLELNRAVRSRDAADSLKRVQDMMP
ncbi:MAG: TIM barrel protein [Candidatus Merdousia sp.]|nr:TIM barrel protein [Candidatus Merdousia sp.]